MKKKLVVVTTDMEIELVMFVDANKLANTREAVSIARKKYYEEDCHSKLFDDVSVSYTHLTLPTSLIV